MCELDTVKNDDGTFSALCYCGWTDDGHATQASADAAAQAHQDRFDAIENGETAPDWGDATADA